MLLPRVCLVDQIEAGNFDDPFGPNHLVRDRIVDLGVVALGGHVFQIAEPIAALVVGESAAHAAENMKAVVLPHQTDEQVVDHTDTIVCRLR